jgi:hypothetical protein
MFGDGGTVMLAPQAKADSLISVVVDPVPTGVDARERSELRT